MATFRVTIDDCEFLDLGYIGAPFTWYNNKDELAIIWARLNRAMATVDWVDKFQSSQVQHLYRDSSYHCPLLICYNKNNPTAI